MPTDPLFWLLAALGVTMTGISKSGLAGGAGVVAVPLLALVIPVPAAAALMLPLLLVMDANTIALYRRALTNSQLLVPIVLSALVGVSLAGFAMGQLDNQHLQLALALFCLVFALWHKLTPWLAKMPGAAWLWGTLAGISSTLLHAGGPPITIYFLSKQLAKAQWLALAAVFFAVVNLAKLIPYTINQMWELHLLLCGLILLPFAFLGVWLGKRLQQRVSEAQFVRLLRGLLVMSGVLLLWKWTGA